MSLLAKSHWYVYIFPFILNTIHFVQCEYSQSSKPPTPSKRKVSNTSTSDDEDKSPPRTRQATKKRQKISISLTKEKESGTSKLASSSDKVSSDESPAK